jgi:hypothetical protein
MGFCAMPKMTDEQEALVLRLIGPEAVASNAPWP